MINFPPKQIGPFLSGCLVTGLQLDDGALVPAVPDGNVAAAPGRPESRPPRRLC